MRQCIYCKNTQPTNQFNREHVIPDSFGTFGPDTPVLNCVCKKCNSFLGKELDRPLARDSMEAAMRPNNLLFSSATRVQRRIRFWISDERLPRIFQKMPHFLNLKTGKMEQLECVRLTKKNPEKQILILKQEIDTFDIADWTGPGIEVEVFSHPSELIRIQKKLIKRGINIIPEKSKILKLDTLDESQKRKILFQMEASVDRTIVRSFCKILINFCAKYIDDQEVLKSPWDKARDFVRLDEGKIGYNPIIKPFWNSQETVSSRFDSDSYNIRIENKNNNIVGFAEFYNLVTHEITLAENYQLPETKIIGVRFTPGINPIIAKAIKKSGKIYIAQYDPRMGWLIS